MYAYTPITFSATQMILVCISDYESLPQINPPQDDSQLNLTGIKVRVGGRRQIKIWFYW